MPKVPLSSLRIGSRRSDLARLQSHMVAARLGTSEFVFKEAPGDVNLRDPLWKMPEMGIFTSFLRRYLLSNEIDLVVHSWKDLPVEPDPDTKIVGTLPRADPRDLLLISKRGLDQAYTTGELVVLSSSPRRQFNLPEFLKKSIPTGPNGERITSVVFRDVRGNIQTRMGKLVEGDSAAAGLVVAKAAIDRFLAVDVTGEFAPTKTLVENAIRECHWQVLPLSVNPTAAAQGALAIEMLRSHPSAADVSGVAKCDSTMSCVSEERSILNGLGGGCHQKIGCTILDRSFGRVKFLRGVSDKLEGQPICLSTIDSGVVHPKVNAAEIAKIGGRGGIELFDRIESPTATEDLLRAISAAGATEGAGTVGMYVAKSDALPAEARKHVQGMPVWTSGVASWFNLAQSGVWVNGTSDSLGESEDIGVEHLTGGTVRWVKVTHSDAPTVESSAADYGVVATYSLVPKMDSGKLDSLLEGKRAVYFASGSVFAEATKLVPELLRQVKTGEVVIGCGPGNTLNHITSQLGESVKVVVAYNYADFVRQVKRED